MNELNILPNILVIDDEETCVLGIKFFLKYNKCNLLIAMNGTQGLEILKSKRIELILLDLMLPDIHGLEILKYIRQDNNISNIPVILQTGSADWSEVLKAKKIGINGFLRKPYQRDVLITTLKKIFHTI